MSRMTEAIERQQIGALENSTRQVQGGGLRPFDDRIYLESDYLKNYRGKVLEVGRSMFREAGVPKLFEELAEIIRRDFPDVMTEERLGHDGRVSSSILWDFRGVSETRERAYNFVEIIACPVTSDLVVRGEDKFVVLNQSQWSSKPELLADAIAGVYDSPLQKLGSLLRF